MTDLGNWALVIQACSHQILEGFLPMFAEKQSVYIGIIYPILKNWIKSNTRLFQNNQIS